MQMDRQVDADAHGGRVLLTADELVELTDRHTAPAQARALKALGIRYRVNPISGKVKVLRSAVDPTVAKSLGEKRTTADFSSLEPTG